MNNTGSLALMVALAASLAACGGADSGSSQAVADAAPRQAATVGHVTAAQAVSTETALTPVGATSSGTERADLAPEAAIDHNLSTRWGSAFSDDAWLTLDYGSPRSFNRVRIDWENAHATRYVLEVSDDKQKWTLLKDVTNSQGGTEDLAGLSGAGRYLRMRGITRSTGYGYSILEIAAFTGTPAGDPAPSPSPVTVDTSKPGVSVKPVAATSSAVENGGMSAAGAIDGNAATRWASTAEDGAWIQFDFGAPTQVGYLKLLWENAYGKQYKLLTSNDGATWTQLRTVTDGQGGVKEFYNLGMNARYLRLQGVARKTQYGYSLFEVEFKTPGSDNTLAANTATSALRFPADGSALAPLPAASQPLETVQFSLADGTLVTRFGARGLARHGRERGEEWNEIGYGPNDTVDPVTGMPQDKGPGNYLTFVPNYFQNRAWGVEIIDNSRVAGVARPQLIVNQYTTVDFLKGGVAFFRGFDRPGVTGYGWMAPGQLVQDNIDICHPTPYPANGVLNTPTGINGPCTILVKDYPGHGGIDAGGLPNGTDVKSRALVQGDVIEVSPSMFTTKDAMAAIGDNGGIRYYSYEWTYVVGKGLRPWYGVQPRLMNAPLPDETLSGGYGSVGYNYSDNALFMFQQPQTNAGMKNMQRFVEGRRLVHSNFSTGDHNEPGNDRNTAIVGLQGARFNQSACIGCHVNNGRSPAPVAVDQRLDSMSVRVARLDAAGNQLPHPQYGTAVQMNARSSTGTPQNWGTNVRVAGFDTTNVTLADGSTVQLRKPKVAFEGPVPDVYSLRSAQPMIGMGLIEAIPEATILANARSAPDADGVKGVANFVFDPETGVVRLGRYGWKASKATLRHQAASALLQDMSVTSPVYRNRSCNYDQAGCAAASPQKGITEGDLQSLANYLSLVAVPAQRSLASGFPKGVAPIAELDVDPARVKAGSIVFQTLRCTACHTAELKTGGGHLFAELRNQTIHPYSDLLLHDMGSGLADKLAEGRASGAMWRTSPLWGIGYTEKVMGAGGTAGYLHDGRARNLTEAILWHGGEGDKARLRFQALGKTDRDALLAFLKSL